MIEESDHESHSSFNTSISATSSERARKKELKQSNVFLLKVMQGRATKENLGSRITTTDWENLSQLIPNLKQSSAGKTDED